MRTAVRVHADVDGCPDAADPSLNPAGRAVEASAAVRYGVVALAERHPVSPAQVQQRFPLRVGHARLFCRAGSVDVQDGVLSVCGVAAAVGSAPRVSQSWANALAAASVGNVPA